LRRRLLVELPKSHTCIAITQDDMLPFHLMRGNKNTFRNFYGITMIIERDDRCSSSICVKGIMLSLKAVPLIIIIPFLKRFWGLSLTTEKWFLLAKRPRGWKTGSINGKAVWRGGRLDWTLSWKESIREGFASTSSQTNL